ncbi:ribosome hibernation-promoting factor, HPF/YfiA family [Streptomonospora nanhaiensis]|uniref:Ribosome hibernation promoting factor n=1 Tax=Streptomonospora nanhaiensis TaxID=1323731 RepID=A0A853BM53_9ACTN|nr:ribosome-associated translation inhibitor RaiA [Streptomonospora nanhaiensis]MBV2362102.1 ribosome-associated translation inhibitor RaiA [Streptomonospora nanhaiensis]MBX9388554.1 ribosome-associated translation inhibitor RaiA [Streptomonospora nanhaiensis]NYI96070.1 ribosomal subunit interface protein [Streptomonospora nanhaiensis]
MDIIVKGRRTGVSDKFRQHVENKLRKLSKWEKKGMTVDVEVSKERNPKLADECERVELTIRSAGPVIRSEACAADRYNALDLAVDRIEARLRKLADRKKVHKGNRAPVSVAAATASLANGTPGALGEVAEPPAVPRPAREPDEFDGAAVDDQFADEFVELDTQGGRPVIVREKFHSAKPMTIDQALLEMELVGHDFYLFHDEDRDAPSVVYRRKGFNYGVLRLVD